MSTPESINVGVSHQIGHYADAVRVPAGYDTILVSGTPGLADDGSLPKSFAEEAAQAWRNVETILARAGATLSDIVSVRQWFTSADDISAYVPVRSQFIKHEPASMLAVIPALVWPDIRLEIEVVAAVPGAAAGR
jgi:2-iminobutanoate/2-iminopropanoate deaminase